ncbi:PQQ-dependent sugar dehydrogenase [Polymorphobacter sp.]|uniref:PQQ-dependent sugar dehydrogenase n=1 Tax=Polymorphobacter sp. TaxID=1909290 RepID=UPI003F7151E4
MAEDARSPFYHDRVEGLLMIENGKEEMTGVSALPRAMLILTAALFATGCNPANTENAASQSGYWVEQVVDGLDHPWAMTWLPNGDMLVTERPGKLRVIRDGALLPEPVAGVPKVLNTSIFDGLLDVKPDPDFKTSRLLFLTFMTGTDSARTGSIMRARLEGNQLVEPQVIFSTSTPAPPGGPNILRILFLPDKTMLVGVGSGGQGSRGMVQRTDNHSGKVIHLNRDGSPVADGPFSKIDGALPELWATGFRNAAGLTRAADGAIWSIDIGPKGGDELNLLKPGGNYGWPRVTWGFDYTGRSMSDIQESPDYVDPVAVWSPSRAPSDLVYYDGNRFPEWRGDLFTAELMGHVVRRLRVRNGKVVQEEALLSELDERIRSVAVGPDGYIYAVTDAARGRLLRVRPGTPTAAEATRVAKPFGNTAKGGMIEDFASRGVYQEKFTQILFNFKYDPERAKTLFGQNCASCHVAGSFTTGEIGPNLNGVAGRQSGQLAGYAFSAAMRDEKTSVKWDRDALVAFISNPQAYYPGTKMAVSPMDDLEAVLQITSYLEATGEPRP